MGYYISGTSTANAKLYVIDYDTDNLEYVNTISGSYQVSVLDGTKKVTIAVKDDDGHSISYGEVTPAFTSVGERGVIGGGDTASGRTNTIEIITMITAGSNTDFGDLTVARRALTSCSNGNDNRAVFMGGQISDEINVMDYINIVAPGDASDFGDLDWAHAYGNATSNATGNRGLSFGGYDGAHWRYNRYITISTLSNAVQIGQLYTGNHSQLAATSNGTNNRAIACGDNDRSNVIQYQAITSTGNTSDFGDLTNAIKEATGTSNSTLNRGIIAGGDSGSPTNVIQYITISTLSNAQDFGDLTANRLRMAACSNGTGNKATFAGGDPGGSPVSQIQQININTLGNATNWGDLTEATTLTTGTSNA